MLDLVPTGGTVVVGPIEDGMRTTVGCFESLETTLLGAFATVGRADSDVRTAIRYRKVVT